MKLKTIIGSILAVAALLKLADMWNLIHWEWLWSQPFTEYIGPVVVLLVGLDIAFEGLWGDKDRWLSRPVPENQGKRAMFSVSCGGDEYIYRGEPFKGAQIDVRLGGLRLDLRGAEISEDEEIDIRTVCGGVELFVPSGVNVTAKSRSFIGGVGNQTERNADPSSKCLHVTSSNILGGVTIKN